MKVLSGFLFIGLMVVGLLYMQGFFDGGKVGPGTEVRAADRADDIETVAVRRQAMPVTSEAVGTVRSRTSTRVSPRIMGTILDVMKKQGDAVERGEMLVRLDDREVRANLAVVEANRTQAQARYDQSAAAFHRYTGLFKKGAATREVLESVTADYESAKALLAGAEEAVKAAGIVVGYAEITAPISGVVAEKLAEPGDLALPGKPMLVIQDPGDLLLTADVREYLIPHLSVGSRVTVTFEAPLSESHESTIDERAPEADPASRTFRVKASLPADSKARPGNFGRLRFTTGTRDALLVPATALRRVGQLETIRVVEDGRVMVRHVRTGRVHGLLVEVLSGLSAGELVAVEGR